MCVMCAAELPTDCCLVPDGQDTVVNADIFEEIDATSSWEFGETNYTLTPGDTFYGHLWVGDVDAFNVDLEVGMTYIATLDASSVEDNDIEDTVLLLVSETGTILEVADDIDTAGGNYYSQLEFSVEVSGTYKLVATSFNTYYNTNFAPDWGYYQLGLESFAPEALRHYSVSEIADYLTYGGWGNVTYKWNIRAGDTLGVDISGLTAEGQTLALTAMQAWTMVTGIQFSTDGAAQISFVDHNAGAYASFSTTNGFITTATVNVSTDWLVSYGTALNSYSFQTYIHEIGHALGLSHGGDYNGSATYGVDNHYLNDSWQLSVMSYFDQLENSNVNGSRAFVVTPQQADIVAAHMLYGASNNLRMDDTTYGDNSTVGGYYDQLGSLDDVTFTLLDNGGTDTIDFRSFAGAQRFDLTPGSFSSVRGESNNLAIAANTVIENLVSGDGDDLIYGNTIGNHISARGGDDMIYSGAGDDTVLGGEGDDRLVGEAGNDTLHGGIGNDILKGRLGNNTLHGEDGDDRLRGADDGNDQLYGGTGSDILAGLNGADRLEGEDGHDFLYGGRGNDIVIGAEGDDVVRGNRNDDLLSGGAGSDRVFGGGGNDTLDGGAGRDFLLGENGNDSLDGGAGNDNLTGGVGADVFVFAGAGYGYDRILDFETGIDLIAFGESSGFGSFAEVLSLASDISAGARLDFGSGDVLLIEGLTVAELVAGDFVL